MFTCDQNGSGKALTLLYNTAALGGAEREVHEEAACMTSIFSKHSIYPQCSTKSKRFL